MTFLSKAIASLLIAGSLFVTGLFWNKATTSTPAPTVSFGAVNNFFPAMIPQTTLSGAGITSSQNTIPVTSFATADGRAVTMAMLGTIGYGTLEPNTTAKEEIVSFTGITQNANGSAILTGVTRGLDFVTPYASTVSLQKSHAGGAYFIISNSAPFYGQQFLLANTLSTSTAGIVFSSTTQPYYDFNPTFASVGSTTLASKGYVDATAIAGGVPGNTSTAGLFILATALQQASSTATAVYNAVTYNLVTASANATDTPQRGCAVGYTGTAGAGCNIIADLTGHIKQAWIDLTAGFSFSGGLTSTATTTLTCSNVNSNACLFRSLAYAWPSVRGASSTVLTEDGSGNLKFITPQSTVFAINGAAQSVSGTTASTTVQTVIIPANTLSSVSALKIAAVIGQSTNPAFFEVDLGNGSASSSLINMNNVSTASSFDGTMYAASASLESFFATLNNAGTVTGTSTIALGTTNTSQMYLAFICRPSSSGSGSCYYQGISVQLIRQ